MGEALKARRLSDAPSGRAAGRLAAGSALSRLACDRRGATAIEYALLVACLGATIVAAIGVLESSIFDVLSTIAGSIQHAVD